MRFSEAANGVKRLALLVFLICLAVPGTSHAQLGGEEGQEEEEREAVLEDFRFGIRVGAVSSSINEAPRSDRQISRREGYALGGFLTFDFRGPLSLQPEIQYIQEGATLRIIDFSGPTISDVHIDFIELPVLLKYQFLSDSPYSLNALGGLAAGYAIQFPGFVSGPGGARSRPTFCAKVRCVRFG